MLRHLNRLELQFPRLIIRHLPGTHLNLTLIALTLHLRSKLLPQILLGLDIPYDYVPLQITMAIDLELTPLRPDLTGEECSELTLCKFVYLLVVVSHLVYTFHAICVRPSYYSPVVKIHYHH